jgi:hypothetical protein
MSNRRVDGFFYGLFMDVDILKESLVTPVKPRRAYVDGYGLRIGRRATLVPSERARSYGMVFALTHNELDRLYSSPGLLDYRPEAVLVSTLDGGNLPALCYNLLELPGPDEANADYAARLRETLARLEFPSEYITSIS